MRRWLQGRKRQRKQWLTPVSLLEEIQKAPVKHGHGGLWNWAGYAAYGMYRHEGVLPGQPLGERRGPTKLQKVWASKAQGQGGHQRRPASRHKDGVCRNPRMGVQRKHPPVDPGMVWEAFCGHELDTHAASGGLERIGAVEKPERGRGHHKLRQTDRRLAPRRP